MPTGLGTRTSLCGGPVANQVLAEDGAYSLCPEATDCLAAHPGTVVWFSTAQEGTPYASIATTATRVDGQPARRGYATGDPELESGVSGVVVLADQHITIGVTAPSRVAVDKVLSSIRIAPVDPLGCAATVKAAASTPAGPSDVLVPAGPTAAVRCQYATDPAFAGLLIGSYLLDPTKAARLASALNELHPDPCSCVHGGTPMPGDENLLYFHYRDGSVLRISGTRGANLDMYTNQTRTVANYSASVGQLLGRLTNQR